MLCRVADSLFWMSRYIERAENTARLVDVNLQLLLELDYDEAETAAHWNSILESFDDRALYDQQSDEITTHSVTEFFTFSRDNPSSVISCVLAARENARMIRDQISSEMWEVINRLYLFLKKEDAAHVLRSGTSEFFQEIKESSHLFRGVTDGTFPRKIGYEFIKAGCYLERADKTARIVNSAQYLEADAKTPRGGALEVIQWVAILRSCSALEAYRHIYVGDVHRKHVIDFLIHSRNLPRSLLFCLSELQLAIHAVSNCPVTLYSNEAERLSGKLISDILYSSVEEIMEGGLHPYLDKVVSEVSKITLELGNKFMFFPVVDPAKEALEEKDEAPAPAPAPKQKQKQKQTQSLS